MKQEIAVLKQLRAKLFGQLGAVDALISIIGGKPSAKRGPKPGKRKAKSIVEEASAIVEKVEKIKKNRRHKIEQEPAEAAF